MSAIRSPLRSPLRGPLRSALGNPAPSLVMQALAILRRPDLEAHVYLPGANGVPVSGLLTNNYTASDGSTGYSANDGVAGLVLDGMAVLGDEKITNRGPFTDTTGWGTSSATIAAVDGELVVTSTSASGGNGNIAVPTTVNQTYMVTGVIRCGTAATVNLKAQSVSPYVTLASSQVVSSTAVTAVQFVFTATTTSTQIYLQTAAANGVTAMLVAVSCKAISGIHATQSTTANKPAVRRGAYNLLLQSQTFDNASWLPLNLLPFGGGSVANATTAPDGTMTADLIVESTATGTHSIRQSVVVSATTNTASVYLKSAGRTKLLVKYISQSSAYELVYATVDLASKTVTPLSGNGGSGAAATLTELSNGWFRLRLTGLIAAKTDGQVQILMTATGAESYTGDGTSGIYIWGAQLETGSTASDYTPTTTAAASNPDAGRYWWGFDGSNDYLQLGSVPFQQSDDHLVVAVVNPTAAGRIFTISSTASANPRIADLSINASGYITGFWKDDAAAASTITGAASLFGSTHVITAWVVGGVRVVRVDGVQIGTNATALGTTTTTTATIGALALATVGNNIASVMNCVLPIKGTFNAQEVLTIERWVASIAPAAPSF